MSAGKSAFLMTEKFAFDEHFRNGAAIQRDERAVAALVLLRITGWRKVNSMMPNSQETLMICVSMTMH